MRSRTPTFLSVLLTAGLALPAQQAQSRPEPERTATTLTVNAPAGELLAAVSISYGQAVWRASHDAALQNPSGNYMRLGIGWWTTFDTVGPIDLGGVRIEAGSYFLGLQMGNDRTFHLLVFDSQKTMQARVLPASTPLYRGDVQPMVRVPMEFAQGSLPEVVGKLQIELGADRADAQKGTLAIRWGKHELSAPLRLLPEPKAEAGKAK